MMARAKEMNAERVTLRNVTEEDVVTLFAHQLDPEANQAAAFTPPDPTDREAFVARWTRILADDTIMKRAILVDEQLAGSLVLFETEPGTPEVGYWLGPEFRGRGVATRALKAFLADQPARPIHAWVAVDNHASVRVLEKCGFRRTGMDRQYSPARGMDVDQLVYTLDASSGAP